MFVVGRLVKDVFDMFTKAILVTQRTQWLVVGLELWGRSQNPKLPRCCSSFDSEWDIFRLLKPQCASHDIIFWGILLDFWHMQVLNGPFVAFASVILSGKKLWDAHYLAGFVD